jgi:hypothetical protein
LGHLVSKRGIEVDRAKVELIENLSPPTSVKQICSFLGHAGFYRCFIKDFSKISRTLCSLLPKDIPFNFDEVCHEAFQKLWSLLSSAVTPSKLGLANPVESLAIHPVEPMCGQIGDRPYKTVKVNARKVNKSESTTIHQVRTWSY